MLLQVAAAGALAPAQAQQNEPPSDRHRAATVGLFLAGGALGLGAHEAGHLFFDVLFDADPGLRKVDFHGIPFFAITHRSGFSPAQEFTISSAGFWVQHAGSEWLLTRRPRLRYEDAPLAKGVLAFNVLASGAYAGAAFFRTGPPERDTKGMADTADIDERCDRRRHPGAGGPRYVAVLSSGFARGGLDVARGEDRWGLLVVRAANRWRAVMGRRFVAWSERERHRAFDDHAAVDAWRRP